MKKVIVTGCSGFLAHHVMRECVNKGWHVTGIDKRPIPDEGHYRPHRFIQTDIRDLNYRDIAGTDYVFHLGWRTNIPDCARHPEKSTDDNIDMSIHLLEVCREAGVKKFMFPSTASLYGGNKTPWSEEMIPYPQEHYSWQKLAIEQACKMYAEYLGLPAVIFRFFQVFGECQREDTALAAFLRCKAEGKPLTLTETTAQSSFRSGQRDFIYAGDLAEAVVIVTDDSRKDMSNTAQIYNVASGEFHSMEEIAKALNMEVKWIPRRPYEVERHHGDISRLRSFGWRPKVDVIDWLKKYAG